MSCRRREGAGQSGSFASVKAREAANCSGKPGAPPAGRAPGEKFSEKKLRFAGGVFISTEKLFNAANHHHAVNSRQFGNQRIRNRRIGFNDVVSVIVLLFVDGGGDVNAAFR